MPHAQSITCNARHPDTRGNTHRLASLPGICFSPPGSLSVPLPPCPSPHHSHQCSSSHAIAHAASASTPDHTPDVSSKHQCHLRHRPTRAPTPAFRAPRPPSIAEYTHRVHHTRRETGRTVGRQEANVAAATSPSPPGSLASGAPPRPALPLPHFSHRSTQHCRTQAGGHSGGCREEGS